jgi:hypothetical protein
MWILLGCTPSLFDDLAGGRRRAFDDARSEVTSVAGGRQRESCESRLHRVPRRVRD